MHRPLFKRILYRSSFSQFNMNSRAGIKISAHSCASGNTQNHAARVIRILIEPRNPRFSADRETGTWIQLAKTGNSPSFILLFYSAYFSWNICIVHVLTLYKNLVIKYTLDQIPSNVFVLQVISHFILLFVSNNIVLMYLSLAFTNQWFYLHYTDFLFITYYMYITAIRWYRQIENLNE